MTVIGNRIEHISFGLGQVINQENNLITVMFDSGKEMSFKYPNENYKNFFRFINLTDEQLEAINNDTDDDKDLLLDDDKTEESDEILFDEKYNYRKSNFYSYIAALEKEKEYVFKYGGKLCQIENGVLIKEDSFGFTYSFEHDGTNYLPDDSSIRIKVGKEFFYGKIIVSDENIVIINVPVKVPPILQFYTSTYIIIDNLSKHVKNIIKDIEESTLKGSIAEKLIKDNKFQTTSGHIITGQDKAVALSLEKDIEFIWGPPGTGKTQTLAKIARTHINQNEKILMLSNSNVAVDEAAYRVYDKENKLGFGKPKPNSIIRYGYPKKEEVLKTEEIISYQIAISSNALIYKQQEELKKEKKNEKKGTKRYAEIIERLKDIRKEFKKAEKNIVKEADFVSTTVAKAVMDKTLYENRFDTVILDEASMLTVPQVVFCASLAKKHFIVMGDFQQLPPIVLSSTKEAPSVLTDDIYDFLGIREAVANHKNHNWLVLLNEQHRFHNEIKKLVSREMYSGLLTTANHVEEDIKDIVVQEPFPNEALVMANTSNMFSSFLKAPNGSYFNVLHAFIGCAIATQYPKNMKIGIITPYNAQARLLKAIIQDINNLKTQRDNPYNITCATVHSFQGSEQDIIIYDAADCYMSPFPSILMTDNRNNISNRLFNVAITRAKGKFIALMNYLYMDEKFETRGKMFRSLFDEIHDQRKTVLSLKSLFPRNEGNPLIPKGRENAFERIQKDIEKCSKTFELYIPAKPKANTFEILDLVKKKTGVKVSIHIARENFNPLFMNYVDEKNIFFSPYNHNPVIIIDSQIIYYGEPLTDATFKLKVGQQEIKYRPILRLKGPHTARVLHYLLK